MQVGDDDWEVNELPSQQPKDGIEGWDWDVDDIPATAAASRKGSNSERIQQAAVSSFSQFLGQYSSDSSDEDDEPEDGHGSSSSEDSGSESEAAGNAAKRNVMLTSVPSPRERRAYEFFKNMLLDKKQDLRKLYMQKKGGSTSSLRCIACAATGRRWKAYRNASSIEQHASNIRRTKNRAEHRGYARAIHDFVVAMS